MSGHSKWATIHRQKEVKDAARGKLFSKFARLITIAAKTGGGADPDSNFKLRDVIEKARAINMPKDNIERAISKASDAESLYEVTYEGFGPSGTSVIVEVATDNKNRTVQEIKGIFERAGGSVGGPGSVAYNFDHKGIIFVEKEADQDSQMLKLIDLGAEDIVADSDLEVYVNPAQLREIRTKFEESGQKVKSTDLTMRPKTYVEVTDPGAAKKVFEFLEQLEDHDDVQSVYTNVDIPDDLLSQIS